MKKTLVGLVVIASMGLVGCASNTQSQNTGIGAVSGAVVGGVAGAALGGGVGGTVLGAVVGGVFGGLIGHSMDSTDHTAMNNAMTHNAKHQTTTWTNEKTGAYYKVTPTSNLMTYEGNSNCRRFVAVHEKHGKVHKMHGVACLQSNGTWMKM